MLKKILAILFFICIDQVARAQQAAVTGVVKTAEGNSLELAAVALKGTSMGTQTNAEGAFQLTVPVAENFTLVVQYVGYKTQELKLKLQAGESRRSEEHTSEL